MWWYSDYFVAYLLANLPAKNVENRSTFGKVIDNIIVDCFYLTHSVEEHADHNIRFNATNSICVIYLFPASGTVLPSPSVL